MLAFEDNFWGEKLSGFEVLHQNYKLGTSGSKEFGEFVKERSGAEEGYSKALLKLAHKTAAHGHIGSFEPCWKFVQNSTEKLANVHLRVIQNLQEVGKVLHEYSETHRLKQKQLKDEFGVVSEAVQNMQTLSSVVQKAKEAYQQKSTEVDKCRKESTTIKEIEKSESKLKKSCEEYKAAIAKREVARKDYESKMRFICKKFQELEKEHISALLGILGKYGESLTTQRFLLDKIIDEFKQNISVLTVDSLLEQLVSSKQTGSTVPVPMEFEAIELTSPPVEPDVLASRQEERKKTKRVIKKKTKRKEKIPANGSAQADAAVPEIEVPVEVDEEGYRIPPPDAESLRSGLSKASSSDSDSDSDDDEPMKFKVTIKPKDAAAHSPSASIDELKTLSANLTLCSPSATSKRHSSTQDDGFFSSSGGLSKTSSNMSRSSNALFDVSSNSTESSPTPPARSRKLFPTSASMDALGEAAMKTADQDKKLVTFGDLFENMPFDASPIVPVQNASAAEQPAAVATESQRKTSEDIAPPPPLPVKKRSMSGNSQSTLGFMGEKSPKEPDATPAATPVVSRDPDAPTPLQRPQPKKANSTSVIPTLAPPSQTSSRRHAGNKKERPLPQPPAKKTSQVDSPEKLSANNAATQGSFLADLADIEFTTAFPTNFPSSQPSESSGDWPGEASSSLKSSFGGDSFNSFTTTPVPLPRGDIQAPRSDGSLHSVSANHEKVTPIAVAFIETINTHFKGSDLVKCDVRITGDMAISFPASIIPLLTSEPSPPPVLAFDIIGTNALEQILPNVALVERCSQMAGGDAITFKFNMAALSSYLKKQSEQGRSASYYNIDIIKYHVRANGPSSAPLQLGAFWKCDSNITDLKIDFKYNSTALPSAAPLTGLSVVVPVSGGVTAMQSKPNATWSAEHMRALWKMSSLSQETGNNGVGSLRARFDVTNGPSNPAVVGVQFAGEGATISNLKFELKCPSYKLSLVKRRFVTGKYIVEP